MFNKLIALCAALFAPISLFAHEVYVLTPDEIASAMSKPPLDFIGVILRQKLEFVLWGFITTTVITIVFLISLSRSLEEHLDPILFKIKHFAPYIAQITLALALIASAHYGALFGVELPLADQFGEFTALITYVLYGAGIMLLLGMYPRLMGIISLVIFGYLISLHGVYMLNYGTYFGEALILALFGGGYSSIAMDDLLSGTKWGKLHELFSEYKFVILRVSFGVSLIYASLYAKLIHGTLALETVTKYELTQFFHFEPIFVVLGAFIIEILIGFFFIIGFEIRFTALFNLVFLTLSLLFFKEAVWPHIILIGTSLAMFVHGYDRFSIETALIKKDKLEPIL